MSNTDRSWPHDAIGNTLKKGDLTRVTLQQPALNFRVVDVRPASTVLSPGADGTTMTLPGSITMIANVTLEFPSGAQLQDVYKLMEPEPDSTITKQ